MKVAYNDFALSDLGEVIITHRVEPEGGEAPQRAKVTLLVKVLLFERCYADNYALLQRAKDELSLPNAVLFWQNEDTGEIYLNQTATLSSADFPEEWGTYFQELNLAFTCYQNLDTTAQNLPLTFLKDGDGQPFQFDHVAEWNDGFSAERFSPLRKQRRETRGKVEVKGSILADPMSPLADRRAKLAAQVKELRLAMNSAEGRLVFGPDGQMFDNTVRIVDFRCDINQAISAIQFSFIATYTLFPDEKEYGTCEATFSETDNASGEFHLAVSGKIQAQTEVAARAKLATVLNAGLKQYGYDKGQQLELVTVPNLISANADGDTFTELSFTGRWRRWAKDNQLATFQGASAEGISFGNVRTWTDHYTAERFDALRDQRSRAQAEIEITGTFAGDPALTLKDRRAALLAMQRKMKAEVNTESGVLKFGDFSQRVRVDDFKAEVNQAVTGIDWTLKVHYTLFPDENTYATCEATAEEKNNFSGELTLSVSGKIRAANETVGRAKLAAVVAAFLAQYGYEKGSQQLELNITPNQISANADGDTFTELSFSGNWRKWNSSNQIATFTATGKSTAIPFGNVKMWDDGYKADRFDQHRSQRRHATGTVSASGTYAADPAMSVKDRRAALLAMQRRMKQECNSAEGKLKYGDWTQVVRIEEFIAHINQAETGIDWAFNASYSLFPNEGGYATAEFTADLRSDTEAGDQYLTFAGEIDAPNGALARAKLNTLRAATLAIYGFTVGQRTQENSTTREISANGDQTASGLNEGIETAGDAKDVSFLRLSFNEVYRGRIPGTILSSNYTVNSRDDTASGLMITSYAGTVTATGFSADAAAAAAIVRAMAIGANQEAGIDPTAFLKSQTMTLERRQTSGSVAEEFVRLSFTFEYQSKMVSGRAYIEVNTQVLADTFGPDAETVSGVVVARDFATAQALYQTQVKAPYAARLIRQESLTQSALKAESPFGPGNLKTQELRLEFSFSAHRDKPAGRVTARYGISVQRDFRNRKRSSRLRGSVYATNRAAADTFLATLAAPLGQLMDSSRDEDHDYTPEADVFTKLDFDDAYEGVLTEQTGLIEMRITEAVVFSGTRWAVQPIPFATNGGGGVSIPQAAGLSEGSRMIRGSVSAATTATALAWAYRHRDMLTGDRDGNFFPQPEQIETEYEFAPRVDGIALDDLAGSGTKANVQIFRVNFTFSEILPNYLPTS